MSNSISLIAILSLFTLLPFIIASGTCFIKFSIVFVIVRNALGLQQVPSNMTLNGVALLLSMFVMMPVGKEIYNNSQNENLSFNNVVDEAYQQYDLFTDPAELEREHRMQKAMLDIKEKFGKNAILKGMDLQKGATAMERNRQIGGHKSGV